ncbi:DUF2599 domain-containing protein [uncultured Corynebacterium sp.]|uniref:DUF2599 domain-containing protein n=1 Tax=uncultured Corynebacterium sp. TaxID=159447 RepID=UPI003454D713
MFGWGIPQKGTTRPNSFACHQLSHVARVEPSWNLEDWCPDVGLPRTIAERCNLGGGRRLTTQTRAKQQACIEEDGIDA